jgi:hypothetical protein
VDSDDANIIDEEVLYNAMGFSVFRLLKERNLLFEGWRDKEIYEIALTEIPPTYQTLKERAAKIGACYAKGASTIRFVTPMLQLASRLYLIVSDADKRAREEQTRFNKDRCYGKWMRYDELIAGFSPVTVEDFIKIEVVVGRANETCLQMNIPETKHFQTLSHPDVLAKIDKILKSEGILPEERKKYLENLKDRLIQGLKPDELRPEYYDLVESMIDQIGRM